MRPEFAQPTPKYPTIDSAAFDDCFRRHVASVADTYFPTRVINVRSVTVGNRVSTIADRCRPMELLRLEVDLAGQADPGTIAVTRTDGSSIGYLDRRATARLRKDAGKPKQWYAVFKRVNHHPGTGEVEGEILLVRMKVRREATDSNQFPTAPSR